MFVWKSDTVGSVLSDSDLVNDSFSIDSWLLSWVLVRDVSEDEEVTFGRFNEVYLEYFDFCVERLSESISEDGTLIFSDFNMFVWTLDTLYSVLSVWE